MIPGGQFGDDGARPPICSHFIPTLAASSTTYSMMALVGILPSCFKAFLANVTWSGRPLKLILLGNGRSRLTRLGGWFHTFVSALKSLKSELTKSLESGYLRSPSCGK